MRQITFSNLADFLKHGREIEFAYKGKRYSITNSHYEWHFCCDTDGTTITLCPFPELDTLAEKTGLLEIESLTIMEIFDRQLYDTDGLDIL